MLGPLQTGSPWGLPSPGVGHHQHHQSPFAADQLGYDGGADAFYADDYDVWSPAGGAGAHRRSFSLSDAEAAASWRPYMYYARGYCKNGSSCRFLHGVPKDDAAEREMDVMRAKALAAAPQAQFMTSAYPFSPSHKGGVSLNFLLQQHQQ
ncbi:unnamed protein product [Miscanthus lutarioriparius]|uniref:C3H1-type domain-containing protein n=1 Tax=Miscanthus lutarioriparius TaxID=422564 RepID=A0A811N4P8_9POAL|nr:unnamed protein product [Miscanthus lutarioriparius]